MSEGPDEYFLLVNISGISFRLTRAMLKKFPETRLGRIAYLPDPEAKMLCDHYLDSTREFYFGRCPTMFACLLSLYRKGDLHVPNSLAFCAHDFLEELAYWEIPPQFIAKCCVSPELDTGLNIIIRKSKVGSELMLNDDLTEWTFREKLWNMFEHPKYTIGGRILAALYLIMLLFSTILIVLSSYEYFGHPGAAGRFMPKGGNLTSAQLAERQEVQEWTSRFEILRNLHYTVTAYFAVEFLFRIYAAPNRGKFLIEPLSIIDIISLVPYILVALVGSFGLLESVNLGAVRQGITVLRILRMCQLLRYAKHLESFKIMTKALFDAKTELGFLLIVVFSLVLMLATIMYCVEYNVPGSKIRDIPTAMYWCFVTISTVGYGDVVPEGPVGKVVACIMTTLGVIFLALPVSIVVSKFTKTYDQKNKVNEMEQRVGEISVSTGLLVPNHSAM